MKTLKFIIPIISFLALSIFFTSCADEQSLNEPESSSIAQNRGDGFMGYPSDSSPAVEEARLELAQHISMVFKKDQGLLKSLFRTLCFPENMENGTGLTDGYVHYENEFFVNLEKDVLRVELGNASIVDHLVRFQGQEAKDVLDYLCQNDPGLAILIEGNIDNPASLDEVFVDNDFDDNNLGNLVPLFANGAPSVMTLGDLDGNQNSLFIVRRSEALLDEYNTDRDVVQIGAACGNEIIVYSCNVCPTIDDDITVDPREDCDEDCDRDCEDWKENLFKFRTKHDHDPGRGKGEFLFVAILSEDIEFTINSEGNYEFEGNPLSYVEKRVGSVKDNFKWRTVNLDVFRWNPENDGLRYKWDIWEEDGGPQVDIELKTTVKFEPIEDVKLSQEFKINIDDLFQSRDDRVGNSLVDYCDPFNFVYRPRSEMEMHCNEREF